jgi:hypothetical protein
MAGGKTAPAAMIRPGEKGWLCLCPCSRAGGRKGGGLFVAPAPVGEPELSGDAVLALGEETAKTDWRSGPLLKSDKSGML